MGIYDTAKFNFFLFVISAMGGLKTTKLHAEYMFLLGVKKLRKITLPLLTRTMVECHTCAHVGHV